MAASVTKYISRVDMETLETVSEGSITVIEDDYPEYTGLVDHRGTPIYKVRDKLPVGFHVQRSNL